MNIETILSGTLEPGKSESYSIEFNDGTCYCLRVITPLETEFNISVSDCNSGKKLVSSEKYSIPICAFTTTGVYGYGTQKFKVTISRRHTETNKNDTAIEYKLKTSVEKKSVAECFFSKELRDLLKEYGVL